MIGTFQVIDHSKQDYPASDKGPARTVHNLHVIDLDKTAPMRQMPKYRLDDDEIAAYAGGKVTGKRLEIEVREMNGAGNPIMRGRIVKVLA